MKVLVFGSAGTGKSFITQALRLEGINAWDADDIEGLSGWFDIEGNQVEVPASAFEALENHYAFLWNKTFLSRLVDLHHHFYLFGGSGNVFEVLDLFDRVYCLTVDPETQRQRLLERAAPDPGRHRFDDSPVIWGQWFEKEARKRHIACIDGTLTPKQIWELIR